MIHYLDDFFVCSTTKVLCQNEMDVMQSAFSELGVPLAPEKIVGPSTCMYLGIEIDTVSNSIRLPEAKFSELSSILLQWNRQKKCTKRELLSLIGSLSFASKVVKPGCMFLRRLIELSTTVASLNHHVSLNAEACAILVDRIFTIMEWC